MNKKISKEKAPRVHDDLKGFDLRVNEFGELVSTLNVDRLNDFLDRNVDDKKLRNLG